MILLKNEEIIVFHYSCYNPCHALVTDSFENRIIIKVEERNNKIKFPTGEPVAIAYRSGEEVIIQGDEVINFDIGTNSVELLPDELEPDSRDRLHERIPVSCLSEMKTLSDSKRFDAIIKNVSVLGLMVYSKADLKIGEKVEFTIFINKSMLVLDSAVVRKIESGNLNKYGLKIDSNDYRTLKNAEQLTVAFREDYLKKIKMEFSGRNSIQLSNENLAFGITEEKRLLDAAQKLDLILKRSKD